LLEVRVFLFHDCAKKLVGEAFIGNHEVKQGDLGGHFWKVVRVPELSCQVEFEFHVVFDDRVSYLNVVRSSTLDDLLLEDRFNSWI